MDYKKYIVRAMRKVSYGVLTTVLVFLIPGVSLGAVQVNSLPYIQNFTSQAEAESVTWVSGGATLTWESNGGWNGGGAVRLTPPTNGDNVAAIGAFNGINSDQVNVRVLAWYSRYYAENEGRNNKVIIFLPNSGQRPMVFHMDYQNAWQAFAPCYNTVCQFSNPDNQMQYWPSSYDQFRVGGGNYEEQWVCMEFEAISVSNELNLYITTPDGRFQGLYESTTGSFGTINAVQMIGGYYNAGNGVARDDNYFKFSNLEIDNSRIGCPEGFVNEGLLPPAPPRNLEISG